METAIADEGPEKAEKEWFPLESNPELLTFFARCLGFDSSIQVSRVSEEVGTVKCHCVTSSGTPRRLTHQLTTHARNS